MRDCCCLVNGQHLEQLCFRRPLVDTSHTSSIHNGGLNLTRGNETMTREKTRLKQGNVSNLMLLTAEAGVKEMIQSLGLLCLVSLLLALGKNENIFKLMIYIF